MKLTALIKVSLVVGLAGGLIGCGTYSHPMSHQHHHHHKHHGKKHMDCASNSVDPVATSEGKRIARVVSDTYHFNFDESELTQEGKAHVEKYADYLAKNKSTKVRIEGHADQRGQASYNVSLGKNRAKAVANYLTEKGVPRKNIEIYSFGAENPVDLATTEEAYSKNRRAEMYFEMDDQESA